MSSPLVDAPAIEFHIEVLIDPGKDLRAIAAVLSPQKVALPATGIPPHGAMPARGDDSIDVSPAIAATVLHTRSRIGTALAEAEKREVENAAMATAIMPVSARRWWSQVIVPRVKSVVNSWIEPGDHVRRTFSGSTMPRRTSVKTHRYAVPDRY